MKEDYRMIIANNICELRKNNKMTQSELAEKLHYSDKAVSRWERGDTMPTIETLCEICDLFNVDLRYLVSKEDIKEKQKFINDKHSLGNRITIMLLAVSLVWLIATCIYVYAGLSINSDYWRVFAWAVPASALVIEVFNIMWKNKKYSIYIRSIFIWSLLACLYLQFLSLNIWLIFLLGIPMEACVILWCRLK